MTPSIRVVFDFLPIEQMPEDWRCLVTDGVVFHVATKVIRDGKPRILLENDITGWFMGNSPPLQEWNYATHYARFPHTAAIQIQGYPKDRPL